jgi:NAD(P)-dependent dehydrogenase (short-subunit alcohol dehydrogenase family)
MSVPIDGARVLVTGASSGIGEAAAELLAARGATLAVVARRADRLRELVERIGGVGHLVLPCDLADPDAAERAALEAWEALGHLDVVVHNAAIPKRRHITRLTPDDVDETMRVNFLSPVRMTFATLDRMRERGSGCHVYVSSMGGRVGIPAEAAYTASKFALCGWAESLALDLWRDPLDVRLIIPGPIDTEIWDVPGEDPADYDGPKEPPSTVAHAIAEAIEGDVFERYVPDMKGVVEWKTGDIDGFLAGAAAMVEGEARPRGTAREDLQP